MKKLLCLIFLLTQSVSYAEVCESELNDKKINVLKTKSYVYIELLEGNEPIDSYIGKPNVRISNKYDLESVSSDQYYDLTLKFKIPPVTGRCSRVQCPGQGDLLDASKTYILSSPSGNNEYFVCY